MKSLIDKFWKNKILYLPPLILFIPLWFYIDSTYKTSEFITLVFTLITFLVTFMFREKVSFSQKKYVIYIVLFLIIPLLSLTQKINLNPDYLYILSVLVLLYCIYYFFKSYTKIYEKIFKEKYLDNIEKIKVDFLKEEEEKEYFHSEKIKFKLTSDGTKVWKNIMMNFSIYHKKESLSLAKKIR